MSKVVHKISFEVPTRTRIYIECRFEPVVIGSLLFAESRKLVTCKRCLAKIKKEKSRGE